MTRDKCDELVPVRIAGIPAAVRVTRHTRVRGSFSRNAPSDLDYYGYTESEWQVCDSKGRAALWLERKMTDDDRVRIDEAVDEWMRQDAIDRSIGAAELMGER